MTRGDGRSRAEPPLAGVDWRRVLTGAAAALGVLALFILVGLVRHLDLIFQGITAEDAQWILGKMYGSSIRVTSRYLLHDFGLHYFGEQLLGYRAIGVALHVGCAYLLFWIYLLLGRQLWTRPGCRPEAWWGGALLAGLLLLCTQMYTMQWLSALAYLVVTFFSLLAVALALVHLRTGWLWPWALSAAAYHGALYSHTFALLLPVFIGALELSSRRPGRASLRALARGALRYGLFGLVLARFVTVNWEAIFQKGMAAASQEVGPDSLGAAAVELLKMRLNNTLLQPFFGVDAGSAVPGWALVLLLCLVAAPGVAQIVSAERRLGVFGLLTLFVLIWGGLTLPQELAAPTRGAHWRGYFLAAGVALVMAAALARILGELSARVSHTPRAVLRLLLALACLGLLLTRGELSLERLARVVSPATRWRHAESWSPAPSCGALTRMTAAQVKQRAAAGASLRCADLSFLELQTLDLKGADLFSARLTGAKLTRANLQGANLGRACLVWARLEQGQLQGADLRRAELSGAVMEDAQILRADLRGAVLRWSRLDHADLRGARLDNALLLETKFEHADLRGLDLTRARAETAYLSHARLEGARLPRKLLRPPP